MNVDITRRSAVAGLSASGMIALGLPSAGVAEPVLGGTAAATAPLPAAVPEPGARSLDLGWRFHLGDIVSPPPMGHEESYANAKAGNARGAAASDYDDGDWRELDLPHDWAIEVAPDPAANLSQGYRRRGIAWYRRTLRLESERRGRYLELRFGAIATNATIWFNGNIVAHNWSGYNSVSIDITSMARFGDDQNSIAVRVDADTMEGWWYEGAGLYRHNWLIERAPVHIITDGVHATPRREPDGRWTLPVVATLYSIADKDAVVTLVADLIDARGAVIGNARGIATVPPLGHGVATVTIVGIAPALWSVDAPNLYTVRTRVLMDGRVIDERVTPAGFRSIRFDADHGFVLNEQPLKIQGVCIHQDHAGVGVAVPDALVEWRVAQLKAMGCNAIRSSHNAPDTALLDACDRRGMLVLDENRNFNASRDYTAQLEWLVQRDRNRPCVFLWSVFNEEPMQGTEAGYEMVRRMAATVKRLDDTRPVTAAMNGGMFTPRNVSQAVDVVGFNYQPGSYDRFHAVNPTKPMMSSEDTSAFITRDTWETNRAVHVMSGDDSQAAPWGATHRAAWRAIAERPWLAGGFVWTGFDYHGEPTPFEWPSKSSYFGIMDLCGFPKSAFWIHQAHWVHDRPVLHLEPHWTWPGREGQTIEVMAISNAERVVLLLNGRQMAAGAIDPIDMATFSVPYAPGVLEAVAYRGDREVARTRIETAGPVAALRLIPARMTMIGDGRDTQPVTIAAVDAKGRVVPHAALTATLAIEGADIIGTGNGDPTGTQNPDRDSVTFFHGLAQAIIRTRAGVARSIRLAARAPGLHATAATIGVLPGAVPTVPATRATIAVAGWRQSGVTAVRPDPMVMLAGNDMNSWMPVTAGDAPAPLAGGGYVLFGATLKPPARMARKGGVIRFAAIAGAGEAWIDGAHVATKADPRSATVVVPLPPGSAQRRMIWLVSGAAGDRIGLAGRVSYDDVGRTGE